MNKAKGNPVANKHVIEGLVQHMGGVPSAVVGIDRQYAITITPDGEKAGPIAPQTSINLQTLDRKAFPVDAHVKITIEVTEAD